MSAERRRSHQFEAEYGSKAFKAWRQYQDAIREHEKSSPIPKGPRLVEITTLTSLRFLRDEVLEEARKHQAQAA